MWSGAIRVMYRPDGGQSAAAKCLLTGSSVVFLVCVLAPTAAAGASHCSAKEETLFSCRTGAKTVSVCASPDLSANAGSLQYRFGRLGAAELLYPTAETNWRQVTRGGVLTFAGGGGSFLSFARGPYRYVVYTAIGKGWGQKAGVVVEKGGKRVTSLSCTDKETSDVGPDLFARAGIAEDPAGFDLP